MAQELPARDADRGFGAPRSPAASKAVVVWASDRDCRRRATVTARSHSSHGPSHWQAQQSSVTVFDSEAAGWSRLRLVGGWVEFSETVHGRAHCRRPRLGDRQCHGRPAAANLRDRPGTDSDLRRRNFKLSRLNTGTSVQRPETDQGP